MSTGNGKFLGFIAFIALMAIALLELIGILPFGLNEGLDNLIRTIKNVGICLVVSITAYKFMIGKSKGLKITYWVCVGIYLLSTIFIWVF
jgi:hypothetical protein